MAKRVVWCALILSMIAFSAVSLIPSTVKYSASTTLAQARAAVGAKRWSEAERLVTQVLRDHPKNQKALLLAAEIAGRQEKYEEALGFYSAVDGDQRSEATARFYSGEIRARLGRLREAEEDLRRAVELAPTKPAYRARLALILLYAGRRWEAKPHLRFLVERRENNFRQLCLLGDPARLASNEEQLIELRRLAPDDPLIRLGLAKVARLREEEEKAESLLRAVVKEYPDLVEAQVQFGDLLARRGEAGMFLAWHSSLPAGAEDHPHLWHVRGLFSASHGEHAAAARCFCEALRREPNHLAATFHLGKAFSRLGRHEESRRIAERVRLLEQVSRRITLIHENPGRPTLASEIGDSMRNLGRDLEARAWFEVALALNPRNDASRSSQATRGLSSLSDTSHTRRNDSPADWIAFKDLPLPDWISKATPIVGKPIVEKEKKSLKSRSESKIRFDLADAGIDFRYFNSADPKTPGARMFEFTGGGAGAFDFDFDGYPDLYFPQGCRWPPDPEQREHLDRLYRNVGDRFIDVTDAANIVEPSFSQGVACGDFNGDGYDDLYVANIGENRLFRNNGDGTFTDVTEAATPEEEAAGVWTVSAAMADLNGDGLADLFDVNYLRGENAYSLICGQGGVPRACSPTEFDAEFDRLLLNRGDGTFEDATALAGIDGPNGTGMGIVAGDFDGSGRLSLFIANDIQNNHFYANVTSSPGGLPRFEEQAVLNGLAYDRDGRAQACMGVAAGDADGDGRADLFVTNYVDESNTLYLQKADGLFVDASRSARLTEPSFKKLGFGTQFLDADLDGWEDLVVVNGHIDDFTHQGYEHRMEPQVFRNEGGRFRELSASGLGSYFREKNLGRGLARLDWNRDGLDDFAVSHLEDPATLLTNATTNPGKSLRLRLVATSTARDAVGAEVSLWVDERKIVRQRFAGDGYAASNEKTLTIGLGDEAQATNVEVRWPSGRTERYDALAAGSRWLLVEGRRRPLRLAESPLSSKALAAIE